MDGDLAYLSTLSCLNQDGTTANMIQEVMMYLTLCSTYFIPCRYSQRLEFDIRFGAECDHLLRAGRPLMFVRKTALSIILFLIELGWDLKVLIYDMKANKN